MDRTRTNNKELVQSIGTRIRQARRAAKLSQDALAARLRIATRTVAGWECGEYLPRAGQLVEIANQLQVTTDWILCRS